MLWFTERNGIGRLTTAGHVAEFSLPAGGLADGGICKGPDGNVWYADRGTNSIGKITPTGTITEYSLPTSNALPTDIAAGPNGNLWFIERQVDQVGKITTAGAVTEYTGGASGQSAIAAGPDGNLYASTSYGIERITTAGVIPHSAAFLGDATANSAPWPATFTGSTTKSPAFTAIGTTGFSTGSVNANKFSPIYETGLPGFYMIGDQYDYVSNNMRTVIVVH